MYSPTMQPVTVFASQLRLIGPASWVGALHVETPLADETKPTSSWHVVESQFASG
jgi:hypothetical protein